VSHVGFLESGSASGNDGKTNDNSKLVFSHHTLIPIVDPTGSALIFAVEVLEIVQEKLSEFLTWFLCFLLGHWNFPCWGDY
jgi:hypothetical protein